MSGDLNAGGAAGLDEDAGLVLEQHFAIVPEWVLHTDLSDAALRLYALLLRHGQSSGQRMPGRAALAARPHRDRPSPPLTPRAA